MQICNSNLFRYSDYGCESYNNTISSADTISPIVIVRRGECTFVQKVRNIEHGGGKVAIIVDEVDYEDPENVIMVDDGTGNGVSIPSIMISKSDGETLIAKLDQIHQDKGYVMIKISFDINRPDDRVEYDIWLSSSNDKALDFIRDFREYHELLGKKVLMTPRYFSWNCEFCDKEITDNDCFSNGKYCAIDETNDKISGRDIMHENLRQKCIYLNSMKHFKDDRLWWNYVIKAHSRCYDDFSEDCSKQIHTQLGLDYKYTET